MEIIDCIIKAWGWTGLEPSEIVGENDFGNLMVRDTEGMYWRLCPEDLSCQVIARDRAELDHLSQNQDFLHDWYMASLVEQAEQSLGPLLAGQKYGLRVPGPLGGEYGGSNIAKLAWCDLVLASGHIAEQIKDLPEGAAIKFSVVD